MRYIHGTTGVLLSFALVLPAPAADKDDDFVPMFNGKDLTGWVNVNCAPSTFYVKDGEIITTGKPTGYLRTTRQYENFIAEFDWMHVPPKPGAVGNSGFFVWADPIPAVGTGYTRGIEVQVLVNLTYRNMKGQITATSQGDLFSIWGATCVPDRPHPDGWARCLPAENHCKGEREWNHYRVEANDGRITLAVSGHVVSGLSKCRPRKGYLALESEGSECHFRNLKIKELPSTNPTKEEIADEANGHRPLFFGELTGWKADGEAKQHWHAKDTVLHYDGKGEAKDNSLRTEKEYGDVEFIADFRFPAKGAMPCGFGLRAREGLYLEVKPNGQLLLGGQLRRLHASWLDSPRDFEGLKPAGQWNRLWAKVVGEGKELVVTINGVRTPDLSGGQGWNAKGAFSLKPEGEMDFANVFVRKLR